MEYRVEQLAQLTNLSVDTIRFYQGKGLLPPPRRKGRCAFYSAIHLERLQTIRKLGERGFSLALIKRALSPGGPEASEAIGEAADAKLLDALIEESAGAATLSRAALSRQSSIPETFIATAQRSGLVTPIEESGEERFTQTDREMLEAGYGIVRAGLPMDEFLELARNHAKSTQALADHAIALFDRHLRKSGKTGEDPESAAAAFRTLLPQVTKLVALHFQRTLVTRALERFENQQSPTAMTAPSETA